MLQGRPLYDNDADRRFFVEPPVWPALRRALEQRLNVMVTGSRGVGKTTLLRQTQATMRSAGERVAFVDATAVGEPLEFGRRVRESLTGRPSPIEESFATMAAVTTRQQAPVAGASRLLARELAAVGDAEPTLILVDASASPEATYGIFGRLRDTLWQLDHRWVVAIDDADRSTVLKPPADAFFDVELGIEPWSTEALTRLLDLRALDVDPPLRDRVATTANGSPRRALRAINDALVQGHDPVVAQEQRGVLQQAADDLGRPYGMLMSELLARGQASPSDDALQQTLGLSRARLTDYLRELLQHELVLAEPERASGPGRPRTIYRPALPTQ